MQEEPDTLSPLADDDDDDRPLADDDDDRPPADDDEDDCPSEEDEDNDRPSADNDDDDRPPAEDDDESSVWSQSSLSGSNPPSPTYESVMESGGIDYESGFLDDENPAPAGRGRGAVKPAWMTRGGGSLGATLDARVDDDFRPLGSRAVLAAAAPAPRPPPRPSAATPRPWRNPYAAEAAAPRGWRNPYAAEAA